MQASFEAFSIFWRKNAEWMVMLIGLWECCSVVQGRFLRLSQIKPIRKRIAKKHRRSPYDKLVSNVKATGANYKATIGNRKTEAKMRDAPHQTLLFKAVLTVVSTNFSWFAYSTAFFKLMTASSSVNRTSDKRSRCVISALSNSGAFSTLLKSICNLNIVSILHYTFVTVSFCTVKKLLFRKNAQLFIIRSTLDGHGFSGTYISSVWAVVSSHRSSPVACLLVYCRCKLYKNSCRVQRVHALETSIKSPAIKYDL